MKKLIALALIGLAIAAHNAFGQITAGEWFSKGREYSRNGDYANAIIAFSETIKLYKPDQVVQQAAAYRWRGDCYFEIKNYDAALADYNIVINRMPNFAGGYLLRGNAYYQLKNYDAAIADYNTYIEKVPNEPTSYASRGDAYGAKGIYHKAIVDYKTGLEKGYDPSTYSVDKSNKSDMWFLGAMYMEILVNRFLGKSDAVAKYENWLKTASDKNKVTRQEIEAFYRDNVSALIAGVVDEWLIKEPINNDTKRVTNEIITTPLAEFYLSPTQSNFDKLKKNIKIVIEIVRLNGFDVKSVNGIENLQRYGNQGRLVYSAIDGGLLNDIDRYQSNAETQELLGNREIAQILRQIATEARNWQLRTASQRFGINNIGNTEFEKIPWNKLVSLINVEIARKLDNEVWY